MITRLHGSPIPAPLTVPRAQAFLSSPTASAAIMPQPLAPVSPVPPPAAPSDSETLNSRVQKACAQLNAADFKALKNFINMQQLALDADAVSAVCDAFLRAARRCGATAIGALGLHGYIFAAPVARALGVPLIPIDKTLESPSGVNTVNYRTIYSSGTCCAPAELPSKARVFLIDDVLALGGSLSAASDLMHMAGAQVVGAGVVVEMDNALEHGGKTIFAEHAHVPVENILSLCGYDEQVRQRALPSYLETAKEFKFNAALFAEQPYVAREAISDLANPAHFDACVEQLVKEVRKQAPVDLIAGGESLGLNYASATAQQMHRGLAIVRCVGKIPGDVAEGVSHDGTEKRAASSAVTGKSVIYVEHTIANIATIEASIHALTAAGARVEAIVCQQLNALTSQPTSIAGVPLRVLQSERISHI